MNLCRFRAFQKFVQARETGLRATFEALDGDGDGMLNAADLAKALEAVRIECPDTRRVYHCRRKVSMLHSSSLHPSAQSSCATENLVHR